MGKNKTGTIKQAGLPKAQWKCDQKPKINEYSESMKLKIFEKIGK